MQAFCVKVLQAMSKRSDESRSVRGRKERLKTTSAESEGQKIMQRHFCGRGG